MLTVSGGTPTYNFLWNLGQTYEDLSNLTAGIYSVTVTDSKLCSKSTNVTVTEPLPITINATVTDITCLNANNGTITLNVSGGTGVYAYKWNTGPTTQNLSNLSDGIYDVTVTDAKSCTASNSYTINQPGSTLSVALDASNLKCRVGADGQINATVNGGTPPYTYIWSNGAPTEDIVNLAASSYTITVTDANSCIDTSTAILTQPPTLLTLTADTTNILCNGASTGEIALTVIDGSVPYTYSWSNGSFSEDVSNLTAGTYMVSVTDANSCTKTRTFSNRNYSYKYKCNL